MNAKLRQIDLQAEILTNMFDRGRISEARFLASIKKLTAQAERIMAKLAK
jgi:hypothetical protein